MGRIKKRRRRINKLRLSLTLFLIFVFSITTVAYIYIKIADLIIYNYDFKIQDATTLIKHNLKSENFYHDNYLKYEDQNYTSKSGIDISSHQGDIDFKKVKKSGIDFVYIRYGYRGYLNGELKKDSRFEEYYKEAKKAGLEVGVYFFSQAINYLEAIDEAYFVLEGIKHKDIDLPIVYDLEDIDYASGRIKDISNEYRTDAALAFAQKIEENGKEPMIYTNLYWANNIYDLNKISNYKLWIAQYADNLDFPYENYLWQYSDKGSVDGISKNVDLNIMFIKK